MNRSLLSPFQFRVDFSFRAQVKPLRAAFTLIELSVSIAIIVVLGFLLFPALLRARATAQSTQCLSNLRQIGAAIFLYVQDNQIVPDGANSSNGGWTTWAQSLAVYVGKERPSLTNEASSILFCPAEKVKAIDPQARMYSNYAANPNVLKDLVTYPNATRIRLAAIPRPAEVFLVIDSTVNSAGYSSYGVFGQTGIYSQYVTQGNIPLARQDLDAGGANSKISFRHDSHTQAVYADGHVAASAVGALLNRNGQITY